MNEFTKDELTTIAINLCINENTLDILNKIESMIENHCDNEIIMNIDDQKTNGIIKISLTPGYWNYFFRDKETRIPLTALFRIFLIKTTDIEIEIPFELQNNKNAVLYILRCK